MHTILLVATTVGLAAATTVGLYEQGESYGGGGFGGSSGGFGGSSGGGDLGGLTGGHSELSLGGGGGGGSYSGPSSYEPAQQHGGSSGGDLGDYHHGVSIVANGENHGTSFDLTKHGGGGEHSGPFGGSFVASAKYEGHSGIAHKVADGDAHGGAGLITFGSPHYTDVLGAGDDGSSGGGGGGYKWGFVGQH